MEPEGDENKRPCSPSTEEADLIDWVRRLSLSLINRRFLTTGRAFEPPPDRDSFLGFRPQYFFFYGSLMDARQLRKVLQLQETPVLHSASIVGWDVMMWGRYPALISKTGNITHGAAYEVQKREHVECLTRHETKAYRVEGCTIKLADGRELSGNTFIWNAERELLKTGNFSLKDWQMEQVEMRMG